MNSDSFTINRPKLVRNAGFTRMNGADNKNVPGPLTEAGAAQQGSSADNVSPAVGRSLGQYTLQEKIGQGGMGHVYRALDTALQRVVALKVLYCGPLDDQKQAQRFLREARNLARLAHPNLLHVYNVGTTEDCHYFAMELLNGSTLLDAIRKRGRLPLAELMPFLAQILSALHYVHQQGITHRDIKSSNMMMCGRRAVLMDFGLAKDENEQGLTSMGAVLGTPEYMPPEAARGESSGAASDVYSLGVVIYEALTGSPPFRGKSALSIIRQHLDAQPPELQSVLPGVDQRIAAVVHRCLQKDPRNRFASCRELAFSLNEIQNEPELRSIAQDAAALSLGETTAAGATQTMSATTGDENPVAVGETEAMVAVAPPAKTETVDAAPDDGTEAKAERSLPGWIFVLGGFFSVFALVILLTQLSKSPSRPYRGIPVNISGIDSEIRWIEMNAKGDDPEKWEYIIERKHADGTWKRETLSQREMAGLKGDGVIEFTREDNKGKP